MEMQMFSGDKAPLIVIDGMKRSSTILEDIDPNNIKSIKVLRDAAATSIYGQEGKNGVLLIEMKKPGDQKPLLIVDGVMKMNEDLNSIDPNNIESVTVLKSDNAVVKYGTMAKDGVVEITTKDENSLKVNASKFSLNVSEKPGKKDPIYIIDGKQSSHKKLQDISTDKIESINVIKGVQAIDKYGNKAKNGAIEITLKDEHENVSITAPKFSMKITDKPGKKDPVYVVDGKVISHRKMKKISSDKIKSISVIKGEQAIEKYGPTAKNGAIEILLKN
jgi:TonB-dependent SusC/RagA subfamily outer membrane receptor